MANEVSASATVKAAKGGASVSSSKSFSISMTGDEMLSLTQEIGTSAEQIGFGGITGAPAILFIQNLDAANYVDISLESDGSAPFIKLTAGKAALFQPASDTIYAKANTAAVRILVTAAEA